MKCEMHKITHGSINRLQMKFARGLLIVFHFILILVQTIVIGILYS
jgi:hypothetical protein